MKEIRIRFRKEAVESGLTGLDAFDAADGWCVWEVVENPRTPQETISATGECADWHEGLSEAMSASEEREYA